MANQAAGPLGSGLAQGVMDIGSQYKVWYQLNVEAQTNGEEYPKFTEWLEMQKTDPMSNSALRTMERTE